MNHKRLSFYSLLLLVLTVTPAFADTFAFSGNTDGGPTWQRPRNAFDGASGSCTLSAVGTNVEYAAHPFTVPADGNYDILLDRDFGSNAFDGVLLLYDERGFDPADQCLGLIAYADDGIFDGDPERILGIELTAGVTYTVVVTGYNNNDSGPYSGTVCPTPEDEAGNIVESPAADATGQTTITGIINDKDEDEDCYSINITDPDNFSAQVVSVLAGSQISLFDGNRDGVAFDSDLFGPRIDATRADSLIMRGDHFLCVSSQNNNPLNISGFNIFQSDGTPNPEAGDANLAFWDGSGFLFGEPTLDYEIALRGVGGAVRFDLEASPRRTFVAPGGSIVFDYQVINNTDGPAGGDVWYEVRRTGFFSNFILARARLTSGTVPGRSQSPPLSYTQNVPPSTQTGTYIYSIKIGNFSSNNVVESEMFFLTVAGPPSATPGLSGEAQLAELMAEARQTGDPSAYRRAVGAYREAAKSELKEVPREAWSVTDVVPWPVEVTPETPTLSASPNPFARQTEIAFSLRQPGDVSLAIYDVRGREVARLADGWVEAGSHRVSFEASSLPSGVYVWRLVAGERVETGRVTLVR